MNFIVKYRKLWLSLFLATLCLHLTGCSTAWTTEAANIINLLEPAIIAVLGILSAFGLGLSPAVMTAVKNWSLTAQTGLAEVKALIEQYNTATAGARPGILVEIQDVLAVISKNLADILPTIKVTDPNTQTRILAVIQAVADEIEALIGLVPALQGKVTDHDEVKKLLANLKSAKEFKKDFNTKAAPFGKGYEI